MEAKNENTLLCIVGGSNFTQVGKIEGKGTMTFNGRITISHKYNGIKHPGTVYMRFRQLELEIAIRPGKTGEYGIDWNPVSEDSVKAIVEVNKYDKKARTGFLCGPIIYTTRKGKKVIIQFKLNERNKIIMCVSFMMTKKRILIDFSKNHDYHIQLTNSGKIN